MLETVTLFQQEEQLTVGNVEDIRENDLDLGSVRQLFVDGIAEQFVNLRQVTINTVRNGVNATVEIGRDVTIRVLDEELGILQGHPNYVGRPLNSACNLFVGHENNDGA